MKLLLSRLQLGGGSFVPGEMERIGKPLQRIIDFMSEHVRQLS